MIYKASDLWKKIDAINKMATESQMVSSWKITWQQQCMSTYLLYPEAKYKFKTVFFFNRARVHDGRSS